MAIVTYPLTYIDIGEQLFVKTKFKPVTPVTEIPQYAKGTPVQLGDTYWTAEFETIPLYRNEWNRMRAWLMLLENGMQTFVGRDMLNSRPLFVDPDIVGTDLNGILDTVATGNMREMVVRSLGPLNGELIAPGDRLHMAYGGRRNYHEVVNLDNQTVTSGEVTIEVRPAIRAGYDLDTTIVVFNQPNTIMRLIPDTWDPGDTYGEGPTTIKFAAQEDF